MTEDTSRNETLDFDNQAVLEVEYQNAQDRLDQQHETLKEFSKEGMQMFRLLLLFIAAPTAILGALDPNSLSQIGNTILSSSCAISGLNTCWSIQFVSVTTGILLLLSSGFNLVASGYEARGIHNLTNPEDIENSLSDSTSLENHRETRLGKYQTRIDHNNNIISIIEILLAAGKICLWFSIYCVFTIVFAVINDGPVSMISWLVILLIFILPLISLLLMYAPKGYREADKVLFHNPLYEFNREEDSKKEFENGKSEKISTPTEENSQTGNECSQSEK